jgi:hypothetical protein
MKTFTTLAAVALVSFGFANSASAFKLSPPSTKFKASGSTSLTKSGVTVPCTANFVGKTSAKGTGKITGASFTGSSTCTAIQATGLPWQAKAISATTANINNVSVNAGPLGTCGPSTVPVQISGSGAITFNNVVLTGGCSVSGTVQSTPAVTIVP